MVETFEMRESTPEVKCNKRPEIIENSKEDLKISFEKIGIENWKIPEDVEVVFKEKEEIENEQKLLGSVNIRGGNVVIEYDEKFSTKEGEEKYTQELREEGKDYPGMVGERGTLKHELAHVVMWDVIGVERQPSIRLIDEGWANLVQKTTQEGLPKEEFKKEIVEGLHGENREKFQTALNFDKVLPERKELNAADSKVGTALLMWVHETEGVKKMVELIKKSPSISKNSDEFKPVELDSEHKHKDEYEEVVKFFKQGMLSEQEAKQKLKEWETKQFTSALEEVTGKEIEDIKWEFWKWIKNYSV